MSIEHTIGIKQKDWGRAMALRAHLSVLFETVVIRRDGKSGVLHPLNLDPGKVLLLAASLRALMFDQSGEPLLLNFLAQHAIALEVSSFEGDFAMMFYSQIKPADDGHLTDFLFPFLAGDKELAEGFPKDEYCEFFFGLKDHIPNSLKGRFDVWSPRKRLAQHSAVGLANDDYMVQLCHITRKTVPITEWGDLSVGYLKDIPIRRRSVIEYAANRIGGVHYDLAHHTRVSNEFRMLSQAYDWEHQALCNGALVATAVCAIELAMTRELQQIFGSLMQAELSRRERLLTGRPIQEFEGGADG